MGTNDDRKDQKLWEIDRTEYHFQETKIREGFEEI